MSTCLIWGGCLLVRSAPVSVTLRVQCLSRVCGVIRDNALSLDAINEVCDGVHLRPREREFFGVIKKLWRIANGLGT